MDEIDFTWITSKRLSCIDHSLVLSMAKILAPTLKNGKYSKLINEVKSIVKKVISMIYHPLNFILRFVSRQPLNKSSLNNARKVYCFRQ